MTDAEKIKLLAEGRDAWRRDAERGYVVIEILKNDMMTIANAEGLSIDCIRSIAKDSLKLADASGKAI